MKTILIVPLQDPFTPLILSIFFPVLIGQGASWNSQNYFKSCVFPYLFLLDKVNPPFHVHVNEIIPCQCSGKQGVSFSEAVLLFCMGLSDPGGWACFHFESNFLDIDPMKMVLINQIIDQMIDQMIGQMIWLIEWSIGHYFHLHYLQTKVTIIMPVKTPELEVDDLYPHLDK